MKDRARGKRDLMTTGRAFIQTSCADLPVFFSTAFGTYESLRPTSLEQPVNAVFFRSKFFLEYNGVQNLGLKNSVNSLQCLHTFYP